MIKEQLGQLEQAEEAASRYLARAPNDLAAYKTVARIQLSKRRPDLAVDTLAKVAATGQGDAETYDLLGRAYAATARSEEAVKASEGRISGAERYRTADTACQRADGAGPGRSGDGRS